MLSPDWEAMFPPPGNSPPPPPVPPSSSTGYTGHMSTPLHKIPIYTIFSSSFFFFFLASHWSDCSGTIFQPAAFVSKQLYLLGYRLFSLALSILCYQISLSFGSKPYGT